LALYLPTDFSILNLVKTLMCGWQTRANRRPEVTYQSLDTVRFWFRFLGRLLRIAYWEGGFVHRDGIGSGQTIRLIRDSDAGLPDKMGDLRIAQARSVVFEGQAIVLFVHAETPQSVEVGEFSQAA
jgi:hypothetical protein